MTNGLFGRNHRLAHAVKPELEGSINNTIECGQLRIDTKHIFERPQIFWRQAQLDCRSGYVPGKVLAANDVMSLMMVECISLEEPSRRQAQPLVRVEAAVDPDWSHAFLKAIDWRRPTAKAGGEAADAR